MAFNISSGDKEASVYLIQIQYLDEQLERCQQKCDELEKRNQDLSARHGALEKDKRDAAEYLKRCLAAKEKKVEEQAEQLKSQQEAAVQDGEALQLQHSREIEEQRERVGELESESRAFASRFEEDRERLKWLLPELVDAELLEKQLVRQREEQEAAVRAMKEQTHLDQENLIEMLKSSADHRVRLASREVLLECLGGQSAALANQQQFLREENGVLRQENDRLRIRERDIYTEMEEMEEELYKLYDESAACSTELLQLSERNNELRAEIKTCTDEYQRILKREEDLKRLVTSALKKRDVRAAEGDRLRAELQRETSRVVQLEGVTQEAAIILTHILTDPVQPSDLQWKARRLLEVLESAAPTGPDSDSSRRGRKPRSSDLKPSRRKESSWDPPPESGAEVKSCDSEEAEEGPSCVRSEFIQFIQ